ncbi:PaaI family thioesterase [Planococcus halotolerans]|uniref:PaaI family thioesterase n=1 Tax=Planococcus halotolerans TaxID=2233542 RepID=A0A365L1Y4_9BACL|nr:PaaI family thioesterase [Planococcus halotolerans]QHJ70863.1 hotdog fold thioesterase [Planococcus halotolerans]RAZ79383.1 PaaI family thioesterase [Planococcus halotolerans]
MKDLLDQFKRTVDNGTPEDIQILSQFLDNLEKKQSGEFTTYLSAALGMQRQQKDDSWSVSIPNTPFIHNNIDIPHGGILAVLLDTAMGTLANSKCPEGFGAVTTNLAIHYLTVATEETITAEAEIIRQGRHTMVIEGNIYETGGKHIATSTGSFFIVPKP